MNTAFTTTLRTAPGILRLGTGNEPLLSFRVQVLDAWETVRVDAPADTPVSVVKERVLAQVMSPDEDPDEYLVKLGGWEVLDENQGIAATGATTGSIFLVSGRRRRPVR